MVEPRIGKVPRTTPKAMVRAIFSGVAPCRICAAMGATMRRCQNEARARVVRAPQDVGADDALGERDEHDPERDAEKPNHAR